VAVAEGVLADLARWPVKSLGGERLAAARLDWRGLAGDRAHALLDRREGREGRWLTIRQAPRLLAWSAAYREAPDDRLDPADPPPPTLRAPDGTVWPWHDPGLDRALAADLGMAVRPHRDLGGQQDLQASVLVTTEASRVRSPRPWAARSSCGASGPTSTWSWTHPRSPRRAGRGAGSRSARSPWPSPTPVPAA